MGDLWLRQSVHGWASLFLGIKSVYTTKVKQITEASASVGLLLTTAVLRWFPIKRSHHRFLMKLSMLMLQYKEILKT